MNDESKVRKHSRLGFQYPVKFKLYSPNLLSRTFMGYIVDISVSGACIQFEDLYGRFNRINLKGSEIELMINMSEGNYISLKASISWIRNNVQAQKSALLIGVEFKQLNDTQIDQINQFFDLKHRDQTMMWNLHDYYFQKDSK